MKIFKTFLLVILAFALTSCSGGGGGGGSDNPYAYLDSYPLSGAVGNYTIAGNSSRKVSLSNTQGTVTNVVFHFNNGTSLYGEIPSAIVPQQGMGMMTITTGTYTVTFSTGTISGTISLTVSDNDITITSGTLAASGSGKIDGSLIARIKLESRNFTRKDLVQDTGNHWEEKKLIYVGDELWIYSNNTARIIRDGRPAYHGPGWGPDEGSILLSQFSNSNLNVAGTSLEVDSLIEGIPSWFQPVGTCSYTSIMTATSSGNGTMTYNRSDSNTECMKGIDGSYYSTTYTETWKILN